MLQKRNTVPCPVLQVRRERGQTLHRAQDVQHLPLKEAPQRPDMQSMSTAHSSAMSPPAFSDLQLEAVASKGKASDGRQC